MNKNIEEVITYDNLVVLTNGEISLDKVNDSFVIKKVKNTDPLVKSYYDNALNNYPGDKNPREEVIFIYLQPDKKESLQIVYAYEGDGNTKEHIIIVTDKFSKLNLVENKMSIDLDSHQVNSTKEIYALDGSVIDYLTFNDLCEGVELELTRCSDVKRDAKINFAFAELSEGNTTNLNYTQLKEQGAECDSKLVTIVKNNKKQIFDVNISHRSKNTSSHNFNRGVIDGSGKAVFNAEGHIDRGYSQSKCHQDSKMLVLSDNAVVECNPILLIDEYDVEASHAAAVGQLDESSLYYLQSRGLTKQECEKLLIYGFLMPVAEVIESKELKEKFINNISQKLNI